MDIKKSINLNSVRFGQLYNIGWVKWLLVGRPQNLQTIYLTFFIRNSCHLLEVQLEVEWGYINLNLSCLFGTNVCQCNFGRYYCWSIFGKVQDNHLDVTDKCSWASIDDFGGSTTIKITSIVRIKYILFTFP